MPVYEFECKECKEKSEIMMRFSEALPTTCKSCGGELVKLISNTSFVLKGTGWYVTDYAKGKRKEETSASPKTETKTDASTGTSTESPAPAEKKPAETVST